MRMCGGLANDAQNVQCTCGVCSPVKMYDFSYMHSRRIHTCMVGPGAGTKKIKKSPNLRARVRVRSKNVSMFGCWQQKTQQKIASRPDKMEHFTHTFESCHRKSTPVCGSRNADNMYAYCTAQFHYKRFRTGLRGNRITGVWLRGG